LTGHISNIVMVLIKI